MRNLTPLLLAFPFLASPGLADVRLAQIFGDHMVLQRESQVAVWGWAEPGEEVIVTPSWGNDDWNVEDGGGLPDQPHVSTTAAEDGTWSVKIATPGAGGPHALSVQGSNEILLQDILVGEVWICSGQSNMQWSVQASDDAQAEIAAADHPQLRLFQAQQAFSKEPAQDIRGSWSLCTPQSIPSFSAAAYYFGRELQSELQVPVGLVSTNWGGTLVEAWTSAEALADYEEFNAPLSRLKAPAAAPADPGQKDWFHRNYPTALFNGMIAPIIPFGMRGAIWYQGESNRARAAQYRRLFPSMIDDWRGRWGQGNFPFYFVQIAPFAYGGDKGEAAELREAQAMTLDLPNTGMAVTMDIGNPKNIHPTNKQDVGKRLARWALAKDYGREVAYSGPAYRLMVVSGKEAWLQFDHAEGGLVAEGGPLTHFTVAGEDRVFHPAEARIDGDTVIVSSTVVDDPQAVRYGWGAADMPNLKNGAGLPASSFRTDSWPPVSQDR